MEDVLYFLQKLRVKQELSWAFPKILLQLDLASPSPIHPRILFRVYRQSHTLHAIAMRPLIRVLQLTLNCHLS